ncbi:MAG: 4Fe-4S dicluster domain-containing protein [Deltaproteobacteria bacterium]|nr:4Fe-4S dicluster domain-containing protein [Deltaproteobacteria bacterium]
MDIYEFIDPFKIYKPAVITIFGWTFLISITIASLFVYRPWCTMFCPFGLVSWFFEKLAIFKIKVNYDTCIECQSCARACPTTVMEVILKRETKTIPDCFACAGCIDACPTDSIPFSSGKRKIPLADKYKKE